GFQHASVKCGAPNPEPTEPRKGSLDYGMMIGKTNTVKWIAVAGIEVNVEALQRMQCGGQETLTTGFIDRWFEAVRYDDFESCFPRSNSRRQTSRSSSNPQYIKLSCHCTLPP